VNPGLPRRRDDTPPDWWQPYKAEFPAWRAWHGQRFSVRLPGTITVCTAGSPEELATQLRTRVRSNSGLPEFPRHIA
jgi:hypothetical protein